MQSTQLISNNPVVLDIHPASGIATIERPLALWERRRFVLAMLVTLGPVGLFPLWFSRRFSRGGKWGITGVYLFATFVLPILMIWYWCDYALRPLAEALK